MSDPLPPGAAVQRLFGTMLIWAGVLIMGLCGLCSAAFLGWGAWETVRLSRATGMAMREFMSFIPWTLIVGGVPILVGLGLFLVGRALRRGAQPPNPGA